MMLILEKLEKESHLSQSEQDVARQIIKLEEAIKDISIRELAKLSLTSTSAVTRLCHKLGFEGYHDFKEKYLEEIRYLHGHFEHLDANIPFSKEDNLAQALGSVGQLYQETIQDTLSMVNYFDYIKAASLLEKSHHIYVLCIGVAMAAGKIFADRMMRIGRHVIASENLNEQYYQSYNALPDDVFIVITYTGTTLKTQKYIENLIRQKAKIIFITSVGENRWKDKVDVTLSMTTREKLYSNIAFYTSTVSTILILDLLYSCYFYRHYDQCFDHKKRVARDYEPYRKASQKIMEEDS